MSTHSIGFMKIRQKLSLNYHQIRTLFLMLLECISTNDNHFLFPFTLLIFHHSLSTYNIEVSSSHWLHELYSAQMGLAVPQHVNLVLGHYSKAEL